MTKHKQRRKITSDDVESICTLITRRRLTETEACTHLGINPQSWFKWKGKPANEAKNANALSRVRAAWIESRCKSIEEVGDGAPGTRRDWRAQAWMLERTLPERFGTQQPPAAPPQPALPASVVNMWISNGYADTPAPQGGEVLDTWSEARQLAETTTTAEPAPPPRTRKAPPMFPSKLP